MSQHHLDSTDILADCLEAIEEGRLTMAECLAQYPEFQAELQELLTLSEALRRAPAVAPTPTFQHQARQRLLDQLPPQPGQSVTILERLRHTWQNVKSYRITRRPSMSWILIIATIVTLAAGGGAVYASDAAVPGETLYGLDRSVEEFRLSFTANTEKTVELQLSFAEERLQEAQELMAASDTEYFSEALTAYDDTMATIAHTASTADSSSREQINTLLESALPTHDLTLSVLANEIDSPNDEDEDNDEDMGESDDDESDGDELVGCTGNTHPVGQNLAAKYEVSYEEIMGWFCSDFGFGEIGLAYNFSQESGVPVSEIFALRDAGLGWGEILHSSDEDEEDEDDNGDISPTATITPTVTITPTTTITPTATITPTVTATPADETTCTGADPHPQGTTLSEHHGVSYEEIMGWFCTGFGFGEIDQAYALSSETGTPVAEIFGLKQSGMGWGQIRQALRNDNADGPGNSGNSNGNNGNNGNGNNGNGGKNGQNPGNSGNGNRGNGNGNGNNGNGNNGNGNGNGNGSSNGNNGNGNGNRGNNP